MYTSSRNFSISFYKMCKYHLQSSYATQSVSQNLLLITATKLKLKLKWTRESEAKTSINFIQFTQNQLLFIHCIWPDECQCMPWWFCDLNWETYLFLNVSNPLLAPVHTAFPVSVKVAQQQQYTLFSGYHKVGWSDARNYTLLRSQSIFLNIFALL